MTGTISLVVPTLNAGAEIDGLLDALDHQTVRIDEVLVVDSSSDDGTIEIAARRGARTVSIPRSDFDHGGTRHEALTMTSGNLVLFLTQDALPADRLYVERLIEPFRDEEVAMASGRQIPKSDAKRFEQLVRGFNYPEEANVRSLKDVETLGIKAFFASDACSAYRRSAYEACGGFPRPCNTNEDMLMAARFIKSGRKVAYAADARVLHSHNLTPIEQFRRNREVGMFLERCKDDLLGASEIGEGSRLVKTVMSQLVEERDFRECGAFCLDCAARIVGNRLGRARARRQMKEVWS